MLNISWNGSTSEVPGTIAVGSGDPKPYSTWKAIAAVSSFSMAGLTRSVRPVGMLCEGHHMQPFITHIAGRIRLEVTRAGAKRHRPTGGSVAHLIQPQDPRRWLPELLGTAKENGHESRFRTPL